MINNNERLKMSLQMLRSMIDVNKEGWDNILYTNCYAYALGLDVPNYKIIDYAYAPGVISNASTFLPAYSLFKYDDLINNIFSDFEALGIVAREIKHSETISDDEWKIALFTVGYNNLLEDYHFLRQHNNGIWYHKNGYRGYVIPYDGVGNIIKNPSECTFKRRVYDKSFALKLK